MHPTDTNFQKLTGEWNKHINKKLKKLYNKKRRAFLKKMFKKCDNVTDLEYRRVNGFERGMCQ